ncbi:HlyD family efflux transporter periplasmic adaptor subunit [Aporhodopirellula aestuarii]|uniref:HlyD family efflux transporter periplasmic adaptor subunit n=1 Tax=Aporhodopirellula aestuarii TaxID=2950107 RepID=A0ABT0U5A7_9BACT|nr:HlyD family efflux transporter periplasmic adaptor subunit [Aporhodopirellula aestuarii]MCM2371618.1 HlyD family efflux transporter periplasmic adaptor subunit [Aporhodopirellula aestuarii]
MAMICAAIASNAQFAEAAEPTVVADLVVVLIDEASVSATTEGKVSEVRVQEGGTLVAGDLMLILDDQKAQIERSLADRSLRIAENRVAATDAVDAAEAEVAERDQLIREHAVRRELNRRRAANDLKIQAAQKAEAVSRNEWMRAKNARQNFSDAVSESEIDALHLALQRAELETLEAKFQREMAEIDVRLDNAFGETLRLKRETAEVALEAAKSAGQVRKLEAEMQRLQLELAQNDLEAHHLRSPIDGAVVAVHVRTGDWVRPGQVVARVINRDRLRVEGFAKAAHAQRLRDSNEVWILILQPNGDTGRFSGGRKFVSPEIDAVTGEVRFWIEFQNDGSVYPGSNARVEIR